MQEDPEILTQSDTPMLPEFQYDLCEVWWASGRSGSYRRRYFNVEMLKISCEERP
jgi:hypothetical protein